MLRFSSFVLLVPKYRHLSSQISQANGVRVTDPHPRGAKAVILQTIRSKGSGELAATWAKGGTKSPAGTQAKAPARGRGVTNGHPEKGSLSRQTLR